jgi:hypothetical protein
VTEPRAYITNGSIPFCCCLPKVYFRSLNVENISDSVSNMYWEHRMNTVKNEGKSEYWTE